MRSKLLLCRTVACVFLTITLCSLALAQQPQARRRIMGPVDESQRVALQGNTHPLARAEFDAGVAPDAQPISRMMLLLSRSPEQQAALDQFVEEQQNPSSPNYRRWLTPAEIGSRFGSNDADVQTIVSWLQQQGFSVERVTADKSVIVFSGSAGQVQQAFRTAIHKYVVNGQEHWANAADPRIPAALAPVIKGLVSLNNFPRKPQSHNFGVYSRDKNGAVTPAFTVGGSTKYYALGPADFSTIYNTKPLLQAGNNGAGQTIAIVGRTNINLQDVTDFRNLFGLGAGNTTVVVDGVDPGIVDGDEMESLLDVQWANAVAPGANVVFVTAADTESSSGLDLAAIHIIENNLAGVMSLSYGACEANLGSAGNSFVQMLWQQAAAQGITVVVSSGDNGSAGCDNQNAEYTATKGLGVNGLASTSYNVAVGGTDFDDAGAQTTYFNATNDSTTLGSAKSYIPERTWNETCAATATAGNTGVCPAMPTSGTPPDSLNLWAGSGGASNCASLKLGVCQGRPKPAWQTGTGVPSDGVRDLPDISFFSAVNSASRSFYVVCQADAMQGRPSCQPGSSIYFMGVGGTSAAAPSFAGIVALAQQKAGTRLGNINYLLYSIAANPGASCASSATPAAGCVFHDTVQGNISVPCKPGSPSCSASSGSTAGVLVNSGQPAFTTTAGYDLATGLGSVDVTNLANAIVTALGHFTPTTTSLQLNGATTPITANHGDPVSVAVTVSPSESTGQVSLVGVNGVTESRTLSAGAASWTTPLLPGGNYQLKAHYAGDGTHGASDSNPISLTISPEASQVFLNFMTWDANGLFQSATANSAPYGSPYVLRIDVADTSATVSSTSGISSKCSNSTASCPTGNVTVTANGNALDGGTFGLNSAGYTEDQSIQLPAGSYTLAAAYAGDPSYNASAVTKSFTISKAATVITASTAFQGPYEYGLGFQISGTLTTTSSGLAPDGNRISIYDNGAPSSAPVSTTPTAGGPSGYAAVSFSGVYAPSSPGTRSVAAHFAGDSNYGASESSALEFVVDKGTTSISGSIGPDTATPTTPVSLSAAVSTYSSLQRPTGTITFYDDGTPVSGSITYGGSDGTQYSRASLTAELSTTFSETGSHAISVSYSGDENYKPSSGNLGTLTVSTKIPTFLRQIEASVSPALKDYPTTLSVIIGRPVTSNLPEITGTVVFSDNGQPLSGAITYDRSYSGYGDYTLRASISCSFSVAGVHRITAAYSGDTNYTPATSSAPLSLSVVDKFNTSLINVSVSNAVQSLPAHLSATIINSDVREQGPTMTGTVEFLDGNTVLSGNVQVQNFSGSLLANMDYTFSTLGNHNISVRYSGDSNYAASQSNTFPVSVIQALEVLLIESQKQVSTSGGTGNAFMSVMNHSGTSMNITLTCQSDSPKASCWVSPSNMTVLPSGYQTPTVSFSVPAVYAANTPAKSRPFTMPIVFAGLLVGVCLAGGRRKRLLAAGLFAVCFILALTSCGGGGGTRPGGGTTVTNPSTYHFTITASSGTITDSKVMTVTLQ